jgi:hypothetical protein
MGSVPHACSASRTSKGEIKGTTRARLQRFDQPRIDAAPADGVIPPATLEVLGWWKTQDVNKLLLQVDCWAPVC